MFFTFYLLVSWLKSLYPMIKQKNYCHELRFHVKSFSSYWDQLGRTLADLMKDSVKVLSLYLDFLERLHGFLFLLSGLSYFFPLLAYFFACCDFSLFPCCLIWLATPQNLLLLFFSALCLHLSFEIDWSYPLCWNECVTLCLLSMQYSEQSCTAFKHVTSSLVGSWQGKCTFFHQDHKIIYFKLLSLHLKCKLWHFPLFVVGVVCCCCLWLVVFWWEFFGGGFVCFCFGGFYCCLFLFPCVWSWIYFSRACSFLPHPCYLLIPSYIPIFPHFFLPIWHQFFFLTDFNILVSSYCSFF